MTGLEYMLTDATEPNLFVFRKQKRDGPEKVTPMLTYYILDGSIYQAPQLCSVFAARVSRTIYNISKAFTDAASKLETIRQGKVSFSSKRSMALYETGRNIYVVCMNYL
jgi:mediator of RNA polymerase II transcription subunit 6